MKLKDHITGPVIFQYYRDGQLWYITSTKFLFPVDINDTGSAIFKNTDKGIYFMRWIRKHMELISEGVSR